MERPLKPVLALSSLIVLFAVVVTRAEPLPLADFEGGVSGFNGALTQYVGNDAKTGKASGKIEADFSRPGDPWVIASRELAIENNLQGVRFWVRSADANGLTVRLVDSSGQTHQQRPTFTADGTWQQVNLEKLTGGAGYQRWGGANDGQFHSPATSIAFILEKPTLRGKTTGVVFIDDVELTVDPNVAVPTATIAQKQLGNIFLTTETVEIGFRTQADQIRWMVTDFWKNQIATGTTPVADHYAAIRPGNQLRGWYAMNIVAQKGGQELATMQTTFCVITPIEIREVSGSPFGVMTHFAQNWDTDILPLIAKAGISTIRDELYWDQVEQKPGQYVFRPQFEKYMAEVKQLGIDPLIVMSFANPLYDEGKTPYTPEGCDAYGRYGQAILKRFGDQIKWLEVWNEYNGTWCTGPAAQDRPRYYAQMLEHANAKIKEVRPDVTVLGGAAVLQPLPYFEGIFKHDGLSNMDAAVIHPYRGNPEGVDQDVADLQNLAKRFNNGKGVPIWATETGLIDTTPSGRDRIARYLVRQYTLLLSSGVEKIYWYLCRDYNEFQSMGLMRDSKDPLGKYVPAPAYVAYANLIRQLNGATFVGRDEVGEHAYVQQFRKGERSVRVCWAPVPAHVAFKAAGPIDVVDMMGHEETLTPVDGQVFVTLTDAPIYLKGSVSPIDGGGRFTIAAEQTVDVAGQLRLKYAYDNRSSAADVTGAIEIRGTKSTFAAKAGERFDGETIIAGEDTTQADARTYWYDLAINGNTAGRGGVLVRIADPLVLGAEPSMVANDTLRLPLANRSSSVVYPVASVEWNVGGTSRTQTIEMPVPGGSAIAFDLPTQAFKPYQQVPVTVKANVTGRAPFTFTSPLSYNPIPKRKVAVDGDLSDWANAASVVSDGKVFVAYDDSNLYLAASGIGDALTAGVASVDGRTMDGWYEFRVTNNGVQTILGPGVATAVDVAGAKVHSTGDTFEITIPWLATKPIQPSDGVFRMALATGDKALFGDGIIRGKTPSLYRIGRFVDEGIPSQANVGPVKATVAPLDAAAVPIDEGKVIADSYQDYSNTQGRNGWSYGYYAGAGQGSGNGTLPIGPYTDDDFRPMKFVATMWGYEWAEPSIQYMKLMPSGGHPGVIDGKPAWAVRRWVSPIDGMVRVTGKLHRFSADGDGVDGKIVVDGIVAWNGVSGGANRPTEANCDVTVAVKKGSLVDVAITPGPGTGLDYDAADFGVQVRQLPTR